MQGSKNTVSHNNLSKQKVRLYLALPSTKLAKFLELKYRAQEKGTHSFLDFTNKHGMKPLTTIGSNKWNLMLESKPFSLQLIKNYIALWKSTIGHNILGMHQHAKIV